MKQYVSPIKLYTLSLISLAALLVNVIARIFLDSTPFLIKLAILVVNTLVLPEPAPAMTKHGPSICCTAFICCSFNPCSKSMFHHPS